MTTPQCNPKASYLAHSDAIDQAMKRVLDSGRYILGEECEAFERSFAEFCGVGHCIGVASGTDAIELILRALGVGRGDLVATVANTAVATVAAIERAGATPVFADIEDGFVLSPESLDSLLASTKGVKAVVAVHLFGLCADMDRLSAVTSKYGIPVVEDCAQAHGAVCSGRRAGSIGVAGAFSFYPTKNLGAFGDGGAITTGDAALAERIRALRQYGWRTRFISSEPGVNSRLDELQAAILNVKLASLDDGNDRRRAIAGIYFDGLKNRLGLENLPHDLPGRRHVYHQFVIRVRRRDEVKKELDSLGVGTAVHYPVPVHLQPAFKDRIRICVPLSKTEAFNDEILSLPMFPELPPDCARSVVDAIGKAIR